MPQKFKCQMKRCLVMSMNLGIQVSTDSCGATVYMYKRTYLQINRKNHVNSKRSADILADSTRVNPPQHQHYQ